MVYTGPLPAPLRYPINTAPIADKPRPFPAQTLPSALPGLTPLYNSPTYLTSVPQPLSSPLNNTIQKPQALPYNINLSSTPYSTFSYVNAPLPQADTAANPTIMDGKDNSLRNLLLLAAGGASAGILAIWAYKNSNKDKAQTSTPSNNSITANDKPSKPSQANKSGSLQGGKSATTGTGASQTPSSAAVKATTGLGLVGLGVTKYLYSLRSIAKALPIETIKETVVQAAPTVVKTIPGKATTLGLGSRILRAYPKTALLIGVGLLGKGLYASIDATRKIPFDKDFTKRGKELSHIDFSGADLRGANFKGMTLIECNFDDAQLDHANFEGAFVDSCSFKDTKTDKMSQKSIENSGRLAPEYFNADHTTFYNTWPMFKGQGTTVKGMQWKTNLRMSEDTEGLFDFEERDYDAPARANKSVLTAPCHKITIPSDKDFTKLGKELRHVDFSGEDLRGANFKGMTLTECNFDDAQLDRANFEKAHVDLCSFRDTKIKYNTKEYKENKGLLAPRQVNAAHSYFYKTHPVLKESNGAIITGQMNYTELRKQNITFVDKPQSD